MILTLFIFIKKYRNMETPISYKRIELKIKNNLEKELIINNKFKEIITEGYKILTYQETYEKDGSLNIVIVCEKYNGKIIL